MTKWRHSGDYGDCISALAIVHAHGDPKNVFYLTDRPGITSLMSPRFKPLRALIEAQPCITECAMSEKAVDCDFVNFRHFHNSSLTLLSSHLRQYQLETGNILDVDGSKPWLSAEPSSKSEGRIVIARSPRYNNPLMQWTKIVHHYGKRLMFVGHPDEHARFVHAFGWVQHVKTKTLLEVAELIAGAALSIMNQSSPLNIAIGLGGDFIEEVCADQPDCIYRRTNAQYVADGSCVLPDIDGSGILEIAAPEQDVSHFNQNVVPPGGWQYPELPASYHFEGQKSLVRQLAGCDTAQAEEKLMRFNVSRVPEFFSDRGSAPMDKFKAAYEKAFQTYPIKA